MKKLLLLFLLLSGLANAQDVLDQSSLGANSGYQTLDSGIVLKQTFVPGITGALSRIDVDVMSYSCNSGIYPYWYACYVYDSSGTMIANQTVGISSSFTRALHTIGFVNPANVISGHQYYFSLFLNPQVCDTSTNSNFQLNWFTAADDAGYSSGTAYNNSSPLGNDMYFQTFIDTTAANPCQNPITASPFVVSGATCGNNDAELSVSPTGGSGPYSYSWSPSGGTSQSTGATLAPGMYTVTVSDTSGCTAQGSVFAFASNPIYATPNIGANISCSTPGSLYANPSGGVGGYTYLWSNSATTQTISGLTTPGIYYVTVSDTGGCSANDSIYLPDMSMNVTVNPYNATCGLNNGYIYANPNYANGPTFSWTGPNGFTSTNQNVFNLEPGTYVLNVTDTVCPAFNDSIIISFIPTYTFTTTINNHISCAGRSDGSATITTTGGSAGYIAWNSVSNQMFNASGTTVNNLPVGEIHIMLNDSFGCMKYDTIYINEPLVLMDSLSFTSPSCGLNNGNISTNVSGGTAPYSYFWNTANTANNLNGIVAGIYMVDITDANGCMISDIATLGTAGGPTITPTVTDITCYNADNGTISVSLSGGTAPYTIYWTDMDSSYTTLNRTNLQAGPYELVVADVNGCQTIFTTEIIEPSPIQIIFTNVTPTNCGVADGSISASVTGGTSGYSYLWNNAVTAPANSNIGAGTYNLTVTDANGCSTSKDASLSDPTSLIAYGYSNVTNCGTNTGSINIDTYNGTGVYSYAWTNGANTEDISGLFPGSYGVTITDDISTCKVALEFTVTSSTASYAPEVCLVTVDTLDEKNIIVWERPAIGGIKEFVIYRETSTAGVYRYIGTNPIDSLTEMKDTLANTDLHSWKYKISAIDSCGVETGVSEIEHRPIYLTVDTNNVGLPSLVWTSYMGRPYSDYVVKRNANGTGWVDVVTLPASQNSFVDLNCPSGIIEYTIEALFTNTCTSTRGAINTTRSNIKTPTSVIIGLKGNTTIANNVSLFPNPSQDNFTVSLANKAKENVSIEVVNALGQIVYTTTINESSKATTIAAANWSNGVYFVRINSTEMHSVIKFVKQ